MYTLKIKWIRRENDFIVDESTLFIAADEVQVHARIVTMSEMSAWSTGSYLDYSVKSENPKEDKLYMPAQVIQVIRNGDTVWYLASMAWLLGPDGKTIERLV